MPASVFVLICNDGNMIYFIWRAAKDPRYLDSVDMEMFVIGPIGIVMGQSAFRVNVGSRVIEATAQYMDCWQLQCGTWRLVASSITPET